MISHFPQIRNEESTYSIFSRLQFAIQPLSIKIMGTMLFNRNTEVGRLNFQGSFDYLCNNLPPKFTSELFFYNNTIYPLFIAFISTEKQERALEYFKGNYPDKTNKCLTISNVNRNRSYIRICKECIKEDFNFYGEPYYRRQHEIELNRMCYKHKVPLYEYTLSTSPTPRRYEDYCSVLGNSKEIIIPEQFKNFFLNIADDINTIFTLNFSNWSLKITKNKIFDKIAEKGYLTINGVQLQKKICQDFKKYYSEEFLDFIGYNFDVCNKDSWLRMFTRNKDIDNPLNYILVIRYLFGSFKEFYNYNKEYSKFKKRPYPCLNIVCTNYNKLVIKDIMETSRILVNKYKNPNLVKIPTIELSNKPNFLLLEPYRNQIISFIKETPDATRLNIYTSNKIVYSYLLKNDYKWLLKHVKILKKHTTISREERTKNFWLNKDELLTIKLLIAIIKIKSEEPPYRRLTVYCLQNLVGYYNFNYNKNMLPKCTQILNKVCETLLAYRCRRNGK